METRRTCWQSGHCELILFGADSELSPHSDHLNLFSWGKVPRVIYESFAMNNCWPIIDPKRGDESLPASTQSSSNREIFDLNESVLLFQCFGLQKIDWFPNGPPNSISHHHWMKHPTITLVQVVLISKTQRTGLGQTTGLGSEYPCGKCRHYFRLCLLPTREPLVFALW